MERGLGPPSPGWPGLGWFMWWPGLGPPIPGWLGLGPPMLGCPGLGPPCIPGLGPPRPGWELGPMGTWVGVPGPLPWLEPCGLLWPVLIDIPEEETGMGPPPIMGIPPEVIGPPIGPPIGPIDIGPFGP